MNRNKITALFLMSLVSIMGLAQGPATTESEDHLQAFLLEVMEEGIEALDSTKVLQLENELIALEQAAHFDCEAICKRKLQLLFAASEGIPTVLFPEIAKPEPECTLGNGLTAYLAGGAHFLRGEFGLAKTQYRQALQHLPTDSKFHLYAQFNLAAVLNQLQELEAAIAAMSAMLDPDGHFRNHPAANDDFIQQVQINLAAIQITAGQYDQSAISLLELDTTSLDPYWKQVVAFNWLLNHQGLAQFEASHQVWKNQIQNIPPRHLPTAVHNAVLHEILVSREFTSFQAFRECVLIETDANSPLLAEGSEYAPLFDPSLDEATLRQLWQSFAIWAEQFEAFARIKLDATNLATSEAVNDLQAKLERAQKIKGYWQLAIASVLTLSLFTFLIITFKKRRQRRSNQRKLEEALIQVQTTMPTQFDYNLEDIRILGDAIAYGKRLSDALLILKKLRISIQDQTDSRHILDLSHVPMIQELNERELSVAQHLAGSFDSKEIARLMQVSHEYIYNVRSRIRSKLNIPGGVDIAEWLREASKTPQH